MQADTPRPLDATSIYAQSYNAENAALPDQTSAAKHAGGSGQKSSPSQARAFTSDTTYNTAYVEPRAPERSGDNAKCATDTADTPAGMQAPLPSRPLLGASVYTADYTCKEPQEASVGNAKGRPTSAAMTRTFAGQSLYAADYGALWQGTDSAQQCALDATTDALAADHDQLAQEAALAGSHSACNVDSGDGTSRTILPGHLPSGSMPLEHVTTHRCASNVCVVLKC